MASESIDINLNTRGADSSARGIKSVGDAAASTAFKLDILAGSQKVFTDSSIKAGKAADTSAAALKSHVAADKLYTDALRVATGETTKFTNLIHKMPGDLDKAASSTDKLGNAAGAAAGTGLAGLGAVQGGGMGALVATAVALSGQLITVGFGLAGLAGAAYGVIKPITNAAQKTGGLAKNLHTLSGEQQVVARGILGLGHTYGEFEKALQPTLLHDFNQGIAFAGHVLHDVEPVAKATGKALGVFVGQFDKLLAGGEWQQFFQFMARTAGPDVQQLGSLFIDLAKDLPPLVEALQPVGTAVLKVADGLAKAAGAAEALGPNALLAYSRLGQINLAAKQASTGTNFFNEALDVLVGPKRTSSIDSFFHSLRDGFHILTSSTGEAVPKTNALAGSLGKWKTVTETVVTETGRLGKETDITTGKYKIFAGTTQSVINGLKAQAHQLNVVAAQYENALGPLGNYIGATITEKQDLVTLNADLKKSHDVIGLKTAAERASFTDTQTYINQTIATGNAALKTNHGIQGQIDVIEKALPRLEAVKGKTADYKHELDLLKGILDKLRAEKLIQENIRVSGTGSWSYRQSGVGHAVGPGGATGAAAGALISGGVAGRDSVPIMAMPGELVVPTGMVKSGAVDHLRGSIPGFASGGIVPSYSGTPKGLPPWTSHNQHATVTAITANIAKALSSSFTAALGANFGGGGSGSAATKAQIARDWMSAGGPGGIIAAIAAAITGAESGFRPGAIQQGQPYATTGWGLWQITPGNSEPQAGINGQLLNPYRNAVAAVAKYRQAGNSFTPWTTFVDGAYLQFMDSGGWLRPGMNHVYNGTGRPEQVLPPGRGGGKTVNNHITVQVGHGTHPVAAAQELVKLLNVGARNGVRLRSSILGPG